MARYALLLRGVNVGAKSSLPMAELRAMLERLGCTAVQTYVQSGNAVLETSRSPAALASAIEAELQSFMGRPVPITLRTGAELRQVVEGNPFPDATDEPTKLCVTFLSEPPGAEALAPLAAVAAAGDEALVAQGREIYTWHPNGQGRSPLAAALAKLRVRGTLTTRNWKTVGKLHELLGG
ncbi:DUF1697 domain-containing protein [Vulgatibacter sp.]|uniref:DUF1697 domain-containing protein n=1 Tax=Vulgatibacter sp. TaxID=1971226 RepID=UPI003563D27E